MSPSPTKHRSFPPSPTEPHGKQRQLHLLPSTRERTAPPLSQSPEVLSNAKCPPPPSNPKMEPHEKSHLFKNETDPKPVHIISKTLPSSHPRSSVLSTSSRHLPTPPRRPRSPTLCASPPTPGGGNSQTPPAPAFAHSSTPCGPESPAVAAAGDRYRAMGDISSWSPSLSGGVEAKAASAEARPPNPRSHHRNVRLWGGDPPARPKDPVPLPPRIGIPSAPPAVAGVREGNGVGCRKRRREGADGSPSASRERGGCGRFDSERWDRDAGRVGGRRDVPPAAVP